MRSLSFSVSFSFNLCANVQYVWISVRIVLLQKAASEVYNVKINVITSDTENWHLLYTPSVIEDESTCREAFLCYIRPVHYNSVRIVT